MRDSISSERLNDYRHAAEQAWGDDTRHERFIGHPQPSHGNCFCGCGERTPLATRTRNGHIKGQPVKWCRGHHRRGFPPNLKYVEQDCGFITPCWVWTGGRDRKQYGMYSGANKGRSQHAHIVSYEWHRGPVPVGLELDHLCRHTLCVNPDHLDPVTHAENIQRSPLCTKLTRQDVIIIRNSSQTNRALAQYYGVSHTNIGYIKNRKTWRNVP